MVGLGSRGSAAEVECPPQSGHCNSLDDHTAVRLLTQLDPTFKVGALAQRGTLR